MKLRPYEEVKNVIDHWIEHDLGNNRVELAIEFLEYDDAKKYLKSGVTREKFEKEDYLQYTEQNVLDKMTDIVNKSYSAIKKVSGERKHPMQRLIFFYEMTEYMAAFAWFLGDDSLQYELDNVPISVMRPMLDDFSEKYNIVKDNIVDIKSQNSPASKTVN